MKSPLCIWAAALLGVVSLHAQDPSPASIVRIQVDPRNARHAIVEDFIGLGYETSAVAQPGFFSAKNTHLVQLYRTLSPAGMIRIGGNVSDHTKFVKDGEAVARPETQVSQINQASLVELRGFLDATGWSVMWGLNLGTGSKEEAVEEALAVKAALGRHLHSFEIGNEVDLLPQYRGNYDGYHAAYLGYKAAIRQAIPDAPFSGPDVAGDTAWCMKFARMEAADLKLATHHHYRTGATKPDATIEVLLQSDKRWEERLEKLRQMTAETGIGYRINEMNSIYGGGKPGVSDTFASALWCLDALFVLASHGCAGVNLQTDINQLGWVSHYSPIFRDDAGRLSARPSYYGMLAFAVAGKGRLLKLTASETPIPLSAYATRSPDGPVWVTLVNKDLTQPAHVELTLPEGCTTAEAYRLTAPSVESRSEVTLAGVQITPAGVWTLPDAEKVSVTGRIASLPVPAASAALVRLR